MKKVYVATKARGFLLHLFHTKFEKLAFSFENNKLYETNSRKKVFLSKLVKSKAADYFGLIQRIKVEKELGDILFSYNRFLKTNKDYVIYLENPLALVHYSTYRSKTFISKLKLKGFLNDPHLKSIICLSKACKKTIDNFYNIPDRVKVEQLYPLIPNNIVVNKEKIKIKCNRENLNCLYISSNFNLKGGKDIIECFKRLKSSDFNNIKLRIITQIDSVDEITMKEIRENNNIEIFPFKFSKEELNQVYLDSCILLNPSRQDSFSLVILEAMKAGNAVISTDLYAIPEMVEDNCNGYLTKPRYRFFNYNNLPNEYVWNNRKGTIYSDYIDNNIVDFLYNKIIYLNENRADLERLSYNSYLKANSGEFSEEYIKEKWEKLFEEIS